MEKTASDSNSVPVDLTPDGHFPARVDREYEQRLLDLCASRSLSPQRWVETGPAFFMAGLAVMLACAEARGFDRPALLALGESLHPGASTVEEFSLWLKRSPVRPSRFLPMAKKALEHSH